MILIKNGRVIDPESGRDEFADILVDDGKIAQIGKNFDVPDEKVVIDAGGCVVSPGLIDVHVHFRDPGFEYKEDIHSGSMAAAKGGFTTVVCMANTKPAVDNKETLSYILKKTENSLINVLQTAAVTVGLQGKDIVNMAELKRAGAAGFTDDGIPLINAGTALNAMETAKALNVPISFHEEDPSLIGNSGINDGAVAAGMKIKGASSVAEDSMIARDCILALESGARVNFQHISSAKAVDLIRHAKFKGADVFAEASPHHFTLTEDDVLKYGTNAKMNPPLRTDADRTGIIDGLKDGTINIIATDHAPHSMEEKDREFTMAPSGIIGLETALALGITELVEKGHLTLSELLEKMTINPARLYNLDSGRIKEGASADVLIFNADEKWTVDKFSSKSSNSPFIGWELKGKVKYTICRGRIVYND